MLTRPTVVDFEGAARQVLMHAVPTDAQPPGQAIVFFMDAGVASPETPIAADGSQSDASTGCAKASA